MDKTRLVATLTADELERWQQVVARSEVVSVTQGRLFTQAEAIEAYLDKYHFLANMRYLYDLDDQHKWNISLFSGQIFASDEEYALD